jgi:hypothetical protein
MAKSAQMTEAAARMPFHLDGDAVPTSRTSSRRSWLSTADGIVCRVEESILQIEDESIVSLQHSISRTFELNLLLGRRVRIALLRTSGLDGGLTQTLTVAGYDGSPLVIAHSGEVRGLSHALGDILVYVALSQRPGGPMAFGTSRLQSLVRVGDHIRVRDGDDAYVMQFDSRREREAAYSIGAEELWRGPPSTKR